MSASTETGAYGPLGDTAINKVSKTERKGLVFKYLCNELAEVPDVWDDI